MKTAPLIPKDVSESLAGALRPRFSALWNFPALDVVWFRAVLAILILGFCCARAYIGLWGTRIYIQDAFSMLDGAWRILNGERPHLDFYTGLGPVTYLIPAAGVVLTRGTADGLAYGQALFGCVVGLWAYLLSERRLRGLASILFCLAVVLIAIVPTTIGDAPSGITPATTYNRFGYALVALVMLESSMAARGERPRDELWGGVSTGLILATLLFLKISFLMGAAFLLAVFFPLRAQTKQRWCGLATGFCFTALAFTAYLRFDLAAMYRDLRTVAHAKHVMLGWYLAKDVVIYAAPFMLLVYAISVSAASLKERNAIRLAGSGVCLTGFFFLLTSWQFFALPLDAVMALLLLDRFIPRSLRAISTPSPRPLVLALGVFLAVSYLVPEVQGLAYGVSQKMRQVPHTDFTAPALAGLNTTVEGSYVEYVNEGCDLLNQHRQTDDSVLALNFTNPFSFGLRMKPPSGGTTWLQYGTDFDEAGPSPERVFQGASLVMLPKKFSDYTLPDTLPRIYGPYLRQHYALEAESLNWWLYRRKDMLASKALSKASVASGR